MATVSTTITDRLILAVVFVIMFPGWLRFPLIPLLGYFAG
jgi:hypothetical protein